MYGQRISLSKFAAAAFCACAYIFISGAVVTAEAQQRTGAEAAKSSSTDGQTKSATQTPPADGERTRGLFRAWLAEVQRAIEKGEINPKAPIEIALEADQDEKGLLANVEVEQRLGDAALANVTKSLIGVLVRSGALQFLGPTHVRLVFKSDAQQVFIRAASKAASEQEASSRARGYAEMVKMAGVVSPDSDNRLIYRSVQVTSEGSQVNMDFAMPRETFCALLSRQLAQY